MDERLAPSSDTSVGDCLALILDAPADRPFVVGQLGQSLDGRIALPNGESRWINGPSALDHLHRLRAACDAVIVGAGTAAADNPKLNVRRAPGTSPVRVVIDPSARVSPDANIFAEDGIARFVITSARRDPLPGVTDIVLPLVEREFEPADIITALFTRGLRRILVEGGAATISKFLAAGALDRLHLLVSPVILGQGKTGLAFPASENLDTALRPRANSYVLSGGDMLFDCDMRSTAGGG